MRLILAAFLLSVLFALPAQAQQTVTDSSTQVDLILPPQLETPDAPFYRGASVKVGEQSLPVIEDKLPTGKIAEYQPGRAAVVISNDANISENRKGQALMDVVSGLQANAVATAAGSEKK
jgi:hypothetical protein